MQNISAKQLQNTSEGRFPKTDARYWAKRIFKPKNAEGVTSPHYSMQVSFQGVRKAFGLRTGNKEEAARKAREIYGMILSHGMEAAFAKYCSRGVDKPEGAATIGQWIEAAKKVFDGKPSSFTGYARSLRYIAASILGIEKTNKRFGRGKDSDFRRKVEAASLEILTPEAIQTWKIGFVAKANGNPEKQRSKRISANGFMRKARSLFSKRITKFITELNIPAELPFKDCQFYPRESMQYQSKVDAGKLLQKAAETLKPSDPEAFKLLLLFLGTGLRRGELDRLLWRQVDLKKGLIRMETTEAGDLKSSDSAGSVSLSAPLVALLREYKEKATGQFVIEGGKAEIRSPDWGTCYRCEVVFKRLLKWERANGLDVQKPIHTLRKEAGSMITTQHGIYAASRFLRHADIQITALHYADHKERVAVDIGALLNPKPATPKKPRTKKPKAKQSSRGHQDADKTQQKQTRKATREKRQ